MAKILPDDFSRLGSSMYTHRLSLHFILRRRVVEGEKIFDNLIAQLDFHSDLLADPTGVEADDGSIGNLVRLTNILQLVGW